jgi:hypothetical protein
MAEREESEGERDARAREEIRISPLCDRKRDKEKHALGSSDALGCATWYRDKFCPDPRRPITSSISREDSPRLPLTFGLPVY